MIVETSALVALVLNEPDTDWFRVAMRTHRQKSMSAANLLEASIVIDSIRNPRTSRELDELLAKFDVDVVPVTESQAQLARQAYRDFGKGSGHRAQ